MFTTDNLHCYVLIILVLLIILAFLIMNFYVTMELLVAIMT